MRRTNVGASIFTAASLLLLPSVSRATTTGPQTALGTPAASQRAPALSYDPVEQVYVLVWEDGRSTANGVDLYVARIGTDGALQDANGIPLLEASVLPDNESQPVIVYHPSAQVHLIAWQEARAAFTDIFAARFLASSGTVIPSAGVQVTSGNDSEGFPSVAAGNQAFLIGYQVNLVGGGARARARRLNLNLTFVDANPFDLSTAGSSFSPAVFGVGSTFQAAWEDNTGDLYARSLPDTGPIPGAPTIVPISTATRTQSALTLGRLGVGNVLVAWEDQRDPGQREIYGQRYTSTLAALGAERNLTTFAADQRDPVVAGDDNGGLLIWQDRRNGAINFPTYAARVDTSGAPRDPAGFPVLIYNANSYEHAVAKGPSNDYLVVSVGGVGPSARISYRIVRDELPAGTMTGMGPANVPADGATAAVVEFGPAAGASGFLVVDGTEYTVLISNPNVVLSAPDVNPTRPGHQVAAYDGQITLSLTSLDHALVDVTVSSVEGTSSGTFQVEFLNVPPVASQVVVGPPNPTSSEDLTLNYSYADLNNDAEGGTVITWTRNNAVESAYNNQRLVPASTTRRDDQWRASVRPRDGRDFGTQVFSNIVIVGNSPPSVINPALSPARDVHTGTALTLRYVFQDPDGDPEGPTLVRWFDRGQEQAALVGRSGLMAAEVIKGQIWQVRIRPNDNLIDGPEVQTGTVAVINTPPVANGGPNGSVLERRGYRLDASASSDIDPQDSLQFTWRQIINGNEPAVTLSDTASVSPSFTAPSVLNSVFLTFELDVHDGDEAAVMADRVTVEIEPVADGDRDELDDEEEQLAGTDPSTADTDRDGLLDGAEVRAGTGPLDEDSDDDGVRDGAEGQTTRNGTDADPLGDPDGDQRVNALDPDSDNDGVLDGTEIGVRSALGGGGTAPYTYAGSDPGRFVADADPNTTTNPNVADTDGDTYLDGVEDPNHDGRIDSGESDPNDPTSPGIPCSAGCPNGLVCGAGDICRPGSPSDAGPMCTPLATTVECCSGGCNAGATKVGPICTGNGSPESCPVGALLCNAGTCQGGPAACAEGADCGDGGCGCRATPIPGQGGGPYLGLLLLGLLGFRAARRRP